MKRCVAGIALLLTIGLSACQNPAHRSGNLHKQPLKTSNVNNLISIIEIPVTDFSRALKFYGSVLNVTIETTDMAGNQMGVVPAVEGTANLVLVKGSDYSPSASGAIIYLHAGADLQPMLKKVEAAGGKVIVPKTEISPEMGFFALFMDTEGNRLGLHSAN